MDMQILHVKVKTDGLSPDKIQHLIDTTQIEFEKVCQIPVVVTSDRVSVDTVDIRIIPTVEPSRSEPIRVDKDGNRI